MATQVPCPRRSSENLLTMPTDAGSRSRPQDSRKVFGNHQTKSRASLSTVEGFVRNRHHRILKNLQESQTSSKNRRHRSMLHPEIQYTLKHTTRTHTKQKRIDTEGMVENLNASQRIAIESLEDGMKHSHMARATSNADNWRRHSTVNCHR